jgi:protein subunit release factor B
VPALPLQNPGEGDALRLLYIGGYPRLTMHFPVELPPHLLELAARLGIHAEDIAEHFTHGGGHGGQKVNKSTNCVELTHKPTGTFVRIHTYRQQSKNRELAYRTLILKIEDRHHQRELEQAREAHRLLAQQHRRPPRSKEQMLGEKHHRGHLKALRKPIV